MKHFQMTKPDIGYYMNYYVRNENSNRWNKVTKKKWLESKKLGKTVKKIAYKEVFYFGEL